MSLILDIFDHLWYISFVVFAFNRCIGQKFKELTDASVKIRENDRGSKKREIRALLHASKELSCDNLLIISEDKDGEEEIQWYGMRRQIKYKTLWKWLLENENMEP